MDRFRITLLICLFVVPMAQADDPMNREIDHLLNTVASSDCVFIRNGKEHGPTAAKEHLNLKRRRGKRYFSSADEFVENLASSSSWSGKPYFIRCGQEERQPASIWFSEVLADYRGAQKTPTGD